MPLMYSLFVCSLLFFMLSSAIDTRIFDAQDLRYDVHKYLVKLELQHRLNKVATCSGSIIDSYWIITSAHCIFKGLKIIEVQHYTENGVKIIAKLDPSKAVLHPEYVYGEKSWKNRAVDITLLRTKRIEFNKFVQPINLAVFPPSFNETGITAGFGDREPNLPAPREGAVVIGKCPVNESTTVICTIDTVRAGNGDSGGSLVSKGRLVGVTSASCKTVWENKPCVTVYSNVAVHLKWIWNVMAP